MEVLDFQKPIIGADFEKLPVVATKDNVVHLEGDFYGPFGIGKQVFSKEKPLIVDGHGKTRIHGALSIMDCHWIELRNFDVYGPIELNDSYPDIGCKHIYFKNIQGFHGTPRGFFTGGHVMEDILVEGCVFKWTVGGTHNFYASGGHWNGDYPPLKNFRIINSKFMFSPAGRNNLQFNGRFDGVLIDNCLFAHAQLNGITLIGVQNAVVRNCVSYGHNRGSGLVIYDYASHWAPYYNHYATQADIDAFRACHHPCQNILVERNTFLVGPKQFSVDAWHGDNPQDGHPAILINNAVHTATTGAAHTGYFEYPTKNIVINDNILVGASSNILDIYNAHEAGKTSMVHNMGWARLPGVPHIGMNSKIKYAANNFIRNPDFVQGPKYGHVNLDENPGYPWEEFKTSFNPLSWPGKQNKVGANIDAGTFWTR